MRRSVFLTVLALAVAVSMLVAASAGSGQHAAITITANSDFTAPGSPGGCASVTAGNGTPVNPYVIGPCAIAAPSGVRAGGRSRPTTPAALSPIRSPSAGYPPLHGRPFHRPGDRIGWCQQPLQRVLLVNRQREPSAPQQCK